MEVINLRTIISSLLWTVCAFIFLPETGAGDPSERRFVKAIPFSDNGIQEEASMPEATQYEFQGICRSRAVLFIDSEKHKPYHPVEAVREIPVFTAGTFHTQYRTIQTRRRGAVAFVKEFLQPSIPARAAPA